jgi:hypothetical protein
MNKSSYSTTHKRRIDDMEAAADIFPDMSVPDVNVIDMSIIGVYERRSAAHKERLFNKNADSADETGDIGTYKLP